MLHEMLKYLVSKGHSAEVISKSDYEFEGVRVIKDEWEQTKKAIERCDLVISHLKQGGRAVNICEFYKKKLVYIAHNTNKFDIINRKQNINVIYNSEYVKSEMRYNVPSIVIHPPVDVKRYKTKKGKKITLINLFERKGVKFFNEIVKLMPDYEFLGVEGGYGQQEKIARPNITYMANTPKAKEIYSQTRILLMPSMYESYGRTAVEAMCSGIPVIAALTPGLEKCLGEAGIFCPLEVQTWVDIIRRLDNKDEYESASAKCMERSKEIEKNTIKELESLEKFLS